MLEKVVDYLLKQFIGKYVESLNTEEISIGYSQSDVVLRDLVIKQDALFSLTDLPFVVNKGKISLIKLEIPLSSKGNKSCVVLVENLELDTYLDISKFSMGNFNDANKREIQKIFLQNLENKWFEVLKKGGLSGLVAFRNAETSYFWSYLFSFIYRITKNIQIEFKNISINYSLQISRFQIKLDSFTLSSFASNEIEEERETKKIFEVSNLSFDYFSNSKDERSFNILPNTNLIGNFTTTNVEEIKNSDTPRFRIEIELDPILLTLTDEIILSGLVITNEISTYLTLQERSFRKPRNSVNKVPREWWRFAASEFVPSLRDQFNSTFVGIKQLTEEATLTNNYVRYYEKYLLRDILDMGGNTTMSKEEFDRLSEDWPDYRVKLLRQKAMSRAAKKINSMNIKQPEKSSDNWGLYWIYSKWTGYSTNTKSENASDQLESESDAFLLINEISISEDVSQLLLIDGLLFQFKVTIGKLSCNLASHKLNSFSELNPLLSVHANILNFGLKLYPRSKSMKLNASLRSMNVINEMIESTATEKQSIINDLLSCMVSSIGQDENLEFLNFTYEVLPPNSKSQYHLQLKAAPLQIVYEHDLINQLMIFLQKCSHFSPENLSTSAKYQFELVKFRTKQALEKTESQSSSSQRKRKETRWSVNLDIATPHILIPKFPNHLHPSSSSDYIFNPLKINYDAILCNFGRFRFYNSENMNRQNSYDSTESTIMQKFNSSQGEKDDGEEEEFLTPCASPVESDAEEEPGGDPFFAKTTDNTKSEKNVHTPFQSIYECYQMQLDDFRIIAGTVDTFIENKLWRIPKIFDDTLDKKDDPHLNEKSNSSVISSMCIVDKFSLTVLLCRRIFALKLIPKKWITSPRDFNLPIGLPNVLVSWKQRQCVFKISNQKLVILKNCLEMTRKSEENKESIEEVLDSSILFEGEGDDELCNQSLANASSNFPITTSQSPIERNFILKKRSRSVSISSPHVSVGNNRKSSIVDISRIRRRILVNFHMNELIFLIDNDKKPLTDIILKGVLATWMKMSNRSTKASLKLQNITVNDNYSEIDSEFSVIFHSNPYSSNSPDPVYSMIMSQKIGLNMNENKIFVDPDESINIQSSNIIQFFYNWSASSQESNARLSLDLEFNQIELIGNPEFFNEIIRFYKSLQLKELIGADDEKGQSCERSKSLVDNNNRLAYELSVNVALKEFSFLQLDIQADQRVRELFKTRLKDASLEYHQFANSSSNIITGKIASGKLHSKILSSFRDFEIIFYKYISEVKCNQNYAKLDVNETSIEVNFVENHEFRDFSIVSGRLGDVYIDDLTAETNNRPYRNKFTAIKNSSQDSYLTLNIEKYSKILKEDSESSCQDIVFTMTISPATYLHSQKFIMGLIDLLADYNDCFDDFMLLNMCQKSIDNEIQMSDDGTTNTPNISEIKAIQNSRIHLNISAHAPYIVLPINSLKDNCLIVDLGQLTATNQIFTCNNNSAKLYTSQLNKFIDQEPICLDCINVPTVIDENINWSIPENQSEYEEAPSFSSLNFFSDEISILEIINIELSHVYAYIGERVDSVIIEDLDPNERKNFLRFMNYSIRRTNEENLCDPFHLDVTVKRLLNQIERNDHPRFTIDMNLTRLEFQVHLLDFCLILGVLGQNLGETGYANDQFILSRYRPHSQISKRKKFKESVLQNANCLNMMVKISLNNVIFNLYDNDYIDKDKSVLFARIVFTQSILRYHSFMNFVTNIDLRCRELTLIDLRKERDIHVVTNKTVKSCETLGMDNLLTISYTNRKTIHVSQFEPSEDISLFAQLNSIRIIFEFDFFSRFFDYILTPFVNDPFSKNDQILKKVSTSSSEVLEMDEYFTETSKDSNTLNTFNFRVVLKETDFLMVRDLTSNESDVLVIQLASCFEYLNEEYIYFIENVNEMKRLQRKIRPKPPNKFSFRIHDGSFFTGFINLDQDHLQTLNKVHIIQPTSVNIEMKRTPSGDRKNNITLTTSVILGKFAYSDAIFLSCILQNMNEKFVELRSLTNNIPFPYFRCFVKEDEGNTLPFDNTNTTKDVSNDFDHIITNILSFIVDALSPYDTSLIVHSEIVFCLIDDCQDADVPLLEIVLSSKDFLNMNVTVPMLSLYKIVLEKLSQESKVSRILDTFERLKKRKPFVPFQLVNLTGEDVFYKLNENDSLYTRVGNDEIVNLNFDVYKKKTHSANFRSLTKFMPKVIVKVDGWRSAYSVAVDRLGIYFRTIQRKKIQLRSELNQLPCYTRLVIEVVRVGSAQNQIILRSGLTLTNNLFDNHHLILGYESIDNLQEDLNLTVKSNKNPNFKYTLSQSPINPTVISELKSGETFSVPLNIAAQTSAKKGYLCFKPKINLENAPKYQWSRFVFKSQHEYNNDDFEVIDLPKVFGDKKRENTISYIDCFDWTTLNEPGQHINQCLYSDLEISQNDFSLSTVSKIVNPPQDGNIKMGPSTIKSLNKFGYNYSLCAVRDVFPKTSISDHGFFEKSTSFRLPFNLPGHHITVSGQMRINNFLPCDISYHINDIIRGNIAPSKYDYVTQVVSAYDKVTLSLKIEGFKQSSPLKINNETLITSVIMRIYDYEDRPLDLEIHINCIEHGCMHISLHAQYWIINNTGLPLIFSPYVTSNNNELCSFDEPLDNNAKQCLSAGQLEENECARLMSPLMFSSMSRAQRAEGSNSRFLQIRIGRKFRPHIRHMDAEAKFARVWSKKIAIDKISSCCIDLRIKTFDHTPDFIYQIGVEIRNGYGKHENTRMIILNPKFVIENLSSYRLDFIQKHFVNKSQGEKCFISAQSGSSFTFHWLRFDCDHLLCFRRVIEGESRSLWSGGLQIDKPNNYCILLHDQTDTIPNFKELFEGQPENDASNNNQIQNHHNKGLFHVSVVLQGSTYKISICDASNLPPPFKIVNNTEMFINYRQWLPPGFHDDMKSNKQVTFTIDPLSSCDYSPEEPLQDSILHLEVRGGTQASYKLYDSVNTKNDLLHYVNLAYISFYKMGSDEVLPGFELINSGQEIDHDDDNLPWVLEVKPDTRFVHIAKMNKQTQRQPYQLWMLTPSGHIFHHGSMSPHDPNESVEKLYQRKLFCLDILHMDRDNLERMSSISNFSNFDANTIKNFEIASLCLNQYNEKRSRYQTWKIDHNLIFNNEANYIVQGFRRKLIDNPSKLNVKPIAFAAKPKRHVLVSSCLVPSMIRPIFYRPGNGTIKVTIDYNNENGPTRYIRIDNLNDGEFRQLDINKKKKESKVKGFLNNMERWNGDGWRYYVGNFISRLKRSWIVSDEIIRIENSRTLSLKGSRVNKIAFSVSLENNFGISLINPFGEELIYASLMKVYLSISRAYLNHDKDKTEKHYLIAQNVERPVEKFILRIKLIQIDNQCLGSSYPVFLYSETGIDNKFSDHVEANVKDSDKQLSIINRSTTTQALNIEFERPYENSWNASIFNFIQIRIGRLSVLAEEILILKLIQFFQLTTKEISEKDPVESEILSFKSQKTTTSKSPYLYTNNLLVHIEPFRISLQTCKNVNHSNLREAKRLLPFLISFTDAELKFAKFELKNNLETIDALGKRLELYYLMCLKAQYLQICGAVDVLGNPIGFINDITTGFSDLVDLDVSGMVKNFTHGFSNAASKLINNVSNITNAASFDSKYLEKRSEILNPKRNIVSLGLIENSDSNFMKILDFSKLPIESLSDFQITANMNERHTVRNNEQSDPFTAGVNNLWNGIYGGATSLVLQPYQGMKEHQIKGLVYGVGKGMIGTFTKPLGGMLDFMSGAFASVSEAAKSSERGRPKRIRPRRAGITINQPIVPFDLADSVGQIILLRNLKNGITVPNLCPTLEKTDAYSGDFDSEEETDLSSLAKNKKFVYSHTTKILYLTTGYANTKTTIATLDALGIARLELVLKLLPCQWDGTVIILTDRAVWCMKNESPSPSEEKGNFRLAINSSAGNRFNTKTCPLLNEKSRTLFIIPYSRIDTCSYELSSAKDDSYNLYRSQVSNQEQYSINFIGDFGTMKRILPCDCRVWAEAIVHHLKEAHFHFIQTAMSIHNRRMLNSLPSDLINHPFAMIHASMFAQEDKTNNI